MVYTYDDAQEHHTLQERALLAGHTYTASVEKDLSASGTINFYLNNPSSTNFEILIYYGDLAHEDETTLEVFSGVSSISGGSSVSNLNNNRISSSNSTSITVKQDVSFTGDTTHQAQVYPGTDITNIFDGYKLVLNPGDDMVIKLTNEGSANSETGLRICFAELKW